jgi:preprotein translocase subunit YajC
LRYSKRDVAKINKKSLEKCLTNSPNYEIIDYQQKLVIKSKRERSNTMNTLTVGSQFTTAKSGVVGTIQEIVKNASGSQRVRLDVNGQPRWTTVK